LKRADELARPDPLVRQPFQLAAVIEGKHGELVGLVSPPSVAQ
jgi:hypothetical protein